MAKSSGHTKITLMIVEHLIRTSTGINVLLSPPLCWAQDFGGRPLILGDKPSLVICVEVSVSNHEKQA